MNDAHSSAGTAHRAWATAACCAKSGRKHLGLGLFIVITQQTADLGGSLETCTPALVLQVSTALTRAALAAVPLASRGSPLHLLPCKSARWLSPAGDGGPWEKHPLVALAGLLCILGQLFYLCQCQCSRQMLPAWVASAMQPGLLAGWSGSCGP